jgi:protein disulfide-isomerase
LTLSVATVCAAGGWDDDYSKALARAKTEKKLVLLDFTGSDWCGWCGWCMKLEKEVFSKSEFKNYAKENLVLVEVDFPHGKRQNAKRKAQNEKLKKEFDIHGYPTLIVLNSEGEKVGQLRYEEGGPKPFVAKLQALQGSK